MNTRLAWLALAAVIGAPNDSRPPAYSFADWEPGEHAVILVIGEGGTLEEVRPATGYAVYPAPRPTTTDNRTDAEKLVALAPKDAKRATVGKVFSTVAGMPVKTRGQLLTSLETLFRAADPASEWLGWWAVVEAALSGKDMGAVQEILRAIAEGLTDAK